MSDLKVSSADTKASPGIDPALLSLLDMNGEVYVQEGGYWIKVEARKVAVTPEMPHGVRYSLTLHAPDRTRVIGFDNAHAVPVKKERFTARRIHYDHWHPDGKAIEPYGFKDAGQLLKDFFTQVDRVLKRRGVVKP